MSSTPQTWGEGYEVGEYISKAWLSDWINMQLEAGAHIELFAETGISDFLLCKIAHDACLRAKRGR